MRKSWKVNRERFTAVTIFVFFFMCCVLILQDPALRQLGVGAKFGVVVLTMTSAGCLLAVSVADWDSEAK
jgi:hypothetical protein